MKYGATADASVSEKLCTSKKNILGITIACSRESVGLIRYHTAMISITPGANNEKTRVNGNKIGADVFFGAIDL